MPKKIRWYVALTAAALASACTAPPPSAAPNPVATPAPAAMPPSSEGLEATLASLAEGDLNTLASDLAAASRIARSARPQDAQAIACFAALSAEVAELSRLKRTTVQPAGAVSSFEANRVRRRGIERMAAPA